MQVKLLHTKDCHVWKDTLTVLEEAMEDAGLEPNYEVIQIRTESEAKKHKFLGSPTVSVNDLDIDPQARKLTNYTVSSCRPYFWQGKAYDLPPKEMVFLALREHS